LCFEAAAAAVVAAVPAVGAAESHRDPAVLPQTKKHLSVFKASKHKI